MAFLYLVFYSSHVLCMGMQLHFFILITFFYFSSGFKMPGKIDAVGFLIKSMGEY